MFKLAPSKTSLSCRKCQNATSFVPHFFKGAQRETPIQQLTVAGYISQRVATEVRKRRLTDI